MLAGAMRNDDLINSLRSGLSSYLKSNPQEKLYLHITQPYYATGDHLWYKVYQTDAFTNLTQSLSGTVYLELIDFTGKEILRQIVKMKEGIGNGDFLIPDSLSTGNYILEARTNWMLNYPGYDSFTIKFTIINLSDSLIFARTPNNDQTPVINLQFYPEGGNLIDEIDSRLVFKAIDQEGKGTSIQGNIFDDQDQLISNFESLFFRYPDSLELPRGLGSVTFMPKKERSYRAKVHFGEKELSFDLPPVYQEGVQFTVRNSPGDSLHTIIRATDRYLNEPYLLLIQSHGELAFYTEGIFRDKVSLNISCEKLKPGINQVMLFDEFGGEISQRLVFIGHNRQIQLSVTTEKNIYTPREKVSVKIQVKDYSGNPISANLSLIVRDKNQFSVTYDYQDNIISQIFLTSELTEDTEFPTFYFSDHSAANKALDLLLLTKIWERFNWTRIKNPNSARKEFRLEQDFSLHGQITIPSGMEYKLDRNYIVLSQIGTEPYFKNQFLYDTAQFTFKELNFNDSNTFDIQVISKQPITEQIEVSLGGPYKTQYNYQPNSVVSITKEMRNYIGKARLFRRIMKDYQLTLSAGLQTSNELKTLKHFEADDIRIMENYLPFADMKDVIREILPNVKLWKNKKHGGTDLLIFDRKSFTHKRKPVFMIDGILEFDQEVILSLDSDNIESIEIVRSKEKTAIFGPYGWGGMMIIHTYDKYYRSIGHDNVRMIEVEGYHTPVIYVAPNILELDDTTPDLRGLTHWHTRRRNYLDVYFKFTYFI